MNRTLSLSTTFNSIHSHSADGKDAHGHRLILRATVEVGATADPATLRQHLDAIRAELHERSIMLMLPAIDQSVLGLAAWAFERLSGPLPKLERVTVYEDDEWGESGTVTRTVR